MQLQRQRQKFSGEHYLLPRLVYSTYNDSSTYRDLLGVVNKPFVSNAMPAPHISLASGLPAAVRQVGRPHYTRENTTCKYWAKGSWKKKASETGKKGPSAESTALHFLEDEDGTPIPEKHHLISDALYKLIDLLDEQGLAKASWGPIGVVAKDWIYNELRNRFHEFELCDNNWKLEAYVTQKYPYWKRKNDKAKNQAIKNEQVDG